MIYSIRMAWAVWATAVVLCGVLPVRAAVVSEVVTGPAGGVGPYVELVTPGAGPFDLVMLDANPDRQRVVLWAVTLEPQDAEVLIVHEGDWALPLPAGASRLSVGALDLGQNKAGASRRLVTFAGVTGWSQGTTAPPLAQWADASHGLPAVVDVATWRIGGWPANPAFGERVQAITTGHAMSRHRDEIGHLPTWSTGPLDVHLQLPNGSPLTPGAINDPLALPEPAALPVLAVLALAARRRTKKPAASSGSRL